MIARSNVILLLAAEFPPATREQWLALVSAALKGATFEKRLVAKTYDGLRIEPLYPGRRDAAPIAGRIPAAPWQVMQRVDHPDPAAANQQALQDLKGGANGLSIILAGSAGSYGYGLQADEDTFERLCNGVVLEAGVAFEFDLSVQGKDAPRLFAALVERRGVRPEDTTIRAGYDPLGALAVQGRSPLAWQDLAPHFARLVGELTQKGFRGPFAVADGRMIHAAGGSEAQELAFVLANGLAYLRALEAHGIRLDAARKMIFFRMAADADQFLTMAKFRALRHLWARIEQACGLPPEPIFISAETAWRMMTRRDSYANMLRTTIAAFAAGVGGADAVTVLPYTMALGLPDDFARRVARNMQLILLEESNLARVADPAAGAGGIEDLTDQLCRAAWALFQEIEKAGGSAAALESGFVQSRVAAVRAEREAAIARRKDALTGTSDYPNLVELPVKLIDVARVAVNPIDGTAIRCEPLPSLRLAEPFERLRDASDDILSRTGARPTIFLANLGPPSASTERATFARNFFAAGGIETSEPDGDSDPSSLVAAFRHSNAKLACLCSSDAIYASEAVAAARALAAAGARHLYLAGRPGEWEAEFRDAGIGTFIYAGCDVLTTLKAAHDILQSPSVGSA